MSMVHEARDHFYFIPHCMLEPYSWHLGGFHSYCLVGGWQEDRGSLDVVSVQCVGPSSRCSFHPSIPLVWRLCSDNLLNQPLSPTTATTLPPASLICLF